MKTGDIVSHPVHGEGTIIVMSEGKGYAVVAYPLPLGGVYRRTHTVSVLIKV